MNANKAAVVVENLQTRWTPFDRRVCIRALFITTLCLFGTGDTFWTLLPTSVLERHH